MKVRPILLHALAIAGLFAVGLYFHHDDLHALESHFDEAVFARAFAAVHTGQSPYTAPTFNYPPPFAVLGTALWYALGERAFLLTARHLELLGVCVVAWLGVVAASWRTSVRWSVALAMVVFAHPVANALNCGNVSPILQAMTLVSLAAAPANPILAGLLLGAGIALKPLAAAMVPPLGALGLRPDRQARWALPTAVAAALTATVTLSTVASRYLPEMLARANVPAPSEYELSIARALRSLGIEPRAMLIFALVAGGAALYLFLRPSTTRGLQAVVITASVVSLPVVWAHTFLITFPVQVLAIEHGLRDERFLGIRRVLLLCLLGAAVISIEGQSGAGTAPQTWPESVRGLLATMPLLGLLILCAYGVGREGAAAR
ncbi:MAG: glycosyltransferase 87 family protein [Acidobacteriota bacterium]